MRIGTAGWGVPQMVASQFPAEGSALSRYGARLNAAEINSTFYRVHRASTFERWFEATPPDFAFSVKVPRQITHEARLVDCSEALKRFVGATLGLGQKLKVFLVQLPPSLGFNPQLAGAFFARFDAICGSARVACEPRHATWFGPEADRLLAEWRVARVAADPARHPQAGDPGGWRGLAYYRMHGSPRPYYSSYDALALSRLAQDIADQQSNGPVWCVFDNTASGEATANALALTAEFTRSRSTS